MRKFFSLIIVSALLALSLPTSHAATDSFSDISASPYKLGIETLVTEGIVSGYSDGSFQPGRILNRAEMLKIVAEATTTPANIDAHEGESCFNDVPTDAWFTKYVCYGKSKGLVNGYENGTLFRPAQQVNFVEALKMTLEAFNIDYDATSDAWYRGMVESASDINAIPFTITRFDEKLARGTMSDMIARILAHNEGTLATYLGDRASVRVSYESIFSGRDLSQQVGQEEITVSFDELADLLTNEQAIEDSIETPDTTAKFIDYSAASLQTALNDAGPNVLFFHASWCHTCRDLAKELERELDKLPASTTVLKIDYDSNQDLRVAHSVVVQHTLIQLDANGEEVTRWTGGGIDNFVENVIVLD